GKWIPERRRALFPAVLARHGLDVWHADLDELAQMIQASTVRQDIVAALDETALAEPDSRRGQRLLRLANAADEADVWRQAVRAALARRDDRRLRQLVRQTGQGKPTPALVRLLAAQFPPPSDEATALLRRMQMEQPRDFWVTFDLGFCLSGEKKHEEAAECYLVAVALRPDSCVARYNRGIALAGKGKHDEAIACYQK